LFGRAKRAGKIATDYGSAVEVAHVADPPALPPAPEEVASSAGVFWNTDRIRLTHELFGPGFMVPGGDKEVIKLVTPIGITSAATLLLVGGGSGGAGRILALQLGLWVRGFEADPGLAAIGARSSQDVKLDRRATSQVWDQTQPEFGRKACHHTLLLMALGGAPAGAILDAVAAAMKPDGHIVMLDIVAAPSTDPSDPALLHWAELEHRLAELPTENDIIGHLRRLQFDVRVVDDVTERHASMVMASWQKLVKNIQKRPSAARAIVMVEEAERWMVRLRLMQEGKLRMIRWHAIRLGVPITPPVSKSGKAA
jgi:cyclopropane fatty-acyl-phospholipid synthase-like methyltransferase